VSGRCGGGDYNAQVRGAGSEFFQQGLRDESFSYAHGVDPKVLVLFELGLLLWGVDGEALEEMVVDESATSPKAVKVVWGGKKEE
jgi:hypothetical protein